MRVTRLALGLALALAAGCFSSPDPAGGSELGLALEVPDSVALEVERVQLTIYRAQDARCQDGRVVGGEEISTREIELSVPTNIQVSPGWRAFFAQAFDATGPVARGCERVFLVKNDDRELRLQLVALDSFGPDAGVTGGD